MSKIKDTKRKRRKKKIGEALKEEFGENFGGLSGSDLGNDRNFVFKDEFLSNNDENNEEFELIPFFASSIVHVSKNGSFTQVLQFEYIEETGNYSKKLSSNPDYYRSERDELRKNMQKIMDDTTNKVNGIYVNPEVIDMDIDFKDDTIPVYNWVIYFTSKLQHGENVYESVFDEEELDYEVNSLYIFEPPLKPVEVESSIEYQLKEDRRIIRYWASEGNWMGPYEKIVFRFDDY